MTDLSKSASPSEPRPNAFATAMLGSLELCGITFCPDLVEEGEPWEVAAKPEPRFFETLTDAIRFYGELPAAEPRREEDECENCEWLRGQVRASEAARKVTVSQLTEALAARASAATAEKFTDREEAVIADLMKSEEMSRTGILRQGLRMYQGVRKGAAKFEWLPVGSLKADDAASLPQPSAGQPSDWIVACEEFRPENHELGGSYKVTMHSGKVWHTTEKPPSAGQTEGK